MRQRQLVMCGFLMAALVVAGCCPATVVEVPPVKGQVVDLYGRPVEGAVVQLAYPPSPDSRQVVIGNVVSAHDGGFSRPADVRWIVFIPMADRPPEPIVQVRALFDGVIGSKGIAGGGKVNQVLLFGLGTAKQYDVGRLVLDVPATQP